jgi:hypothetical protein
MSKRLPIKPPLRSFGIPCALTDSTLTQYVLALIRFLYATGKANGKAAAFKVLIAKSCRFEFSTKQSEALKESQPK